MHKSVSHCSVLAGRGLGEGEHALPVLLYGAAHPEAQTLASIRRACGYFKGAGAGSSAPRPPVNLFSGASCVCCACAIW